MFKYFPFLLWLLSTQIYSQTISISGNIVDTAGKSAVSNAVAIAVRFSDSTLVSYARSDKNGFFKLPEFPTDTYIVIVSHPHFGDQQLFVMGSGKQKEILLPKIVLPPRTISLQEVVIVGYTDPMYYKGDTLVYTADSFKVKPNAVVEDLLKKLPGIKVDAQGKIYSQGKAIDQLLVDGDEFFGADPTIATRNLDAKVVESVQVYDKANAAAGTGGANEPLKIMDLKLKADAKKGAFGKISAAGDFSKFYEGHLLANHFRNKMKLSVFSLASNTPNTNFGWEDMNEYGLSAFNDWSFDEELGPMGGGFNEEKKTGLPKTLKTGVYYANKFHNKTGINANYSYNPSELFLRSGTLSQYLFADTSYRTIEQEENTQKSGQHQANLRINYDLDSMSDLVFTSKMKYRTGRNLITRSNQFIAEDDALVRTTEFTNDANSESASIESFLSYSRRFKNKKKWLNIIYRNNFAQADSRSILISEEMSFLSGTSTSDSLNQEKTNNSGSLTHNGSAEFNLPLSDRIFLYSGYTLSGFSSVQNKRTLDFENGAYVHENPVLTNNYEVSRTNHQGNVSIAYEVKRYKITLGAKGENRSMLNINKVSGETLKQDIGVILPYLKYNYNFKSNARLNFQYLTNSKLPGISQLQPIPDNSNPNRISVGNPDLLPTFGNIFRGSFNSYKPVSGRYIWIAWYFVLTNRDFSNSVTYDSLGRSFTKTVNVDGNHRSAVNINFTFPFLEKKLELSPSLSFSNSRNLNFIDGSRNITINSSAAPGLTFSVNLEKMEYSLSTNYSYNAPSSTLAPESNQPYSSVNYRSTAKFIIRKTFTLYTEAQYFRNDKRIEGYNIDYLIWKSSLSKTFFKKENFIVTISVNDILNQNIDVSRIVQDNVITDKTTNTVGRYFLIGATFKFKSNKSKENEQAP